MQDTLPKMKPVATHRTETGEVYHVYADGALYRAGSNPYLAGYVMDAANIEYAVDMHEEELRYLMADFL